MDRLKDVEQLLHQAAYYPAEIDRILDPDNPAFIRFDPVLGYELKDYDFNDGQDGILSDYVYMPHGGHRQMVNYADAACRINTYGDSFTQCAQVSQGETWQEILAAHFHEPIRNFGVGGYGVYQAYRRALRVEEDEDLAAEYIILNIWDDDHKRNLDAARWIRVAWMYRDLPRGKKDSYPVHGFPWAHLRYDLETGTFVDRPALIQTAEELRTLVGKQNYYEAYKDDSLAHLYALTQGGDAPVAHLERIAEALGVSVDLRTEDVETRMAEADRLHLAYAMRSTQEIVDRMQAWAAETGRKLMVLLSYDVPSVTDYLEKGERWDREMVDYLDRSGLPYVDALAKAGEEYKAFRISIKDFIARHYVGRAGAQVFGHYNAAGNFWFAHAVKDALVEWLNPKPPSYRT